MAKSSKKNRTPNVQPKQLAAADNNLSPLQILQRKCLDPLEVMEILRISRTTLNNWCLQDLLKPSRLGKRLYFDTDDLIALLESGKNKQVQ